MKKLYPLFIILIAATSTSFAVEPLSENDMGDLALDSGQNLLQLYGPTAAGLRIDAVGKDDLEKNTSPEDDTDETSLGAAESTLKTIEEQLTDEFTKDRQDLNLDPKLQAIIKPVERVVGQAAYFDTTSEIQYDKNKFKHDATFNADGTVQHDRDLQIDLLKFENIGGDDLDDPSTIGSIYISDWTSEGGTTTRAR